MVEVDQLEGHAASLLDAEEPELELRTAGSAKMFLHKERMMAFPCLLMQSPHRPPQKALES